MKKFCLLICLVVLLHIFSGCAAKVEVEEPVSFYYCNAVVSFNSPTSVLKSEIREAAGFAGDSEAMLNSYLLGPVSTELQSVIPQGTSLVSCSIDGKTAYLQMSSQFSNLSGVRLTLACSGLLMTMHDYSGIEVLKIRVQNSQLDDKEEIVIKWEDLVLMDILNVNEK